MCLSICESGFGVASSFLLPQTLPCLHSRGGLYPLKPWAQINMSSLMFPIFRYSVSAMRIVTKAALHVKLQLNTFLMLSLGSLCINMSIGHVPEWGDNKGNCFPVCALRGQDFWGSRNIDSFTYHSGLWLVLEGLLIILRTQCTHPRERLSRGYYLERPSAQPSGGNRGRRRGR